MDPARFKSGETTYVDGLMGQMAEDLSKRLGATFRVVRTREEFQWHFKYHYNIQVSSVEEGGYAMNFERTTNHNEIKRSLAMLSDLLNMGYIKSEPDETP